MTLTARCLHTFPRWAVEQGERCCDQGRVTVDDLRFPLGGSIASCIIQEGPRSYRVVLDWSSAGQGRLATACACPVYRENRVCHHVWASLQALDELGAQVAGRGTLQLVPLAPEDIEPDEEGFWCAEEFEDDEYEDEFDYDDEQLGEEIDDIDEEAEEVGFDGLRRPWADSAWTQQLSMIRHLGQRLAEQFDDLPPALPVDRQALYAIDLPSSRESDNVWLDCFFRERRRDGKWGKARPLRLDPRHIGTFPDPADRRLLHLLIGSAHPVSWEMSTSAGLPGELARHVIPDLCATGRLVWLDEQLDADAPLAWDDGPAWRLRLVVGRQAAAEPARWAIRGELVRGEESVSVSEPRLIVAGGLVFFADRVARFDGAQDFGWVIGLRRARNIGFPAEQWPALAEQLAAMPRLPDIVWPEDAPYRPAAGQVHGHLEVLAAHRSPHRQKTLVRVSYRYGDQRVAEDDVRAGVLSAAERTLILRDRPRERELLARLTAAGAERPDRPRRGRSYGGRGQPTRGLELLLPANCNVPQLLHALINEGWQVDAEGYRMRRPGALQLSVTSAVDWFELDGRLEFEGVAVQLPQLLEAVRRGQRVVALDDGSCGLLPDEWLDQFSSLAQLAGANQHGLRFAASQAALLDALLAAQEHVELDAQFLRFRRRLERLEGVRPKDEPPGFQGQLRPYQRDGLGWLRFLRAFRLGGCLADDMGLGKTVQVLALLEHHHARGRRRSKPLAPSLVVVPRSLIFNWMEEAARFTPRLRLLDYTGLDRQRLRPRFAEVDVVLTTYGTLRRDVLALREQPLEYVVLDEAQAIKNAASQTAKASRLLPARYRLAMTGTPVENHLGELWSLFEFLNPGMLGRAEAFDRLARAGLGDDRLETLRRALRPFLLRRTKEQVLRELPEKTEQTLYCQMGPQQQKLYDELREYFRAQLGQRIERQGLARSKMHVLEALLRLRQVACHPALLDEQQQDGPSAKLDLLMDQLEEVADEGHKALVFSQFTSLLALVRRRLDKQPVNYEYLDGRTRKRKERVERFQTDPDCRLFLISLKAGGQGLNLTAADYVYILDPWWNPAVEAQAVDRAHRIGQSRPVFAYRLICRGTVEEKIVQLQQSKRELADAIITADAGLLRDLSAADLQLLLS